MAKDFVCGMTVNEQIALKSTFQGKTYYFCSDLCKKIFEREPEKYAALAAQDKEETESK